jgi:hypothetical protein
MSGYRKPKARLHREFVYLNHDTVLNSLSALEAGKVDEIIEKTSEAREGGLSASVTAGPVVVRRRRPISRRSSYGLEPGSPHLTPGTSI